MSEPPLLTILIPTKNRHPFLVRLLDYYRRLEFDGVLLIADSSDPDHMDLTKRAVDAIGADLTIVYRTYPTEIESRRKRLDALGFVTTPYVAICGDDDFLVPSMLSRAVEFVGAHPDYSVAHGDAALFVLKSGLAHGAISWLGRYPQRRITQQSGAERLRYHFAEYTTAEASVHQTQRILENYGKTSSSGENYNFRELLTGSLAVIQGKVHKLDGLYTVRQAHSQQTSAVLGGRVDVFDWIADPIWSEQYTRFRDCLAEELVREDGISIDEAREVVKEAFWSYLARGLSAKWKFRYQKVDDGLRVRSRAAARRVPGLRGAWHKARSFLPGAANNMSLPALLRSTSPYHADFMPVYRAITTPPVQPNGATSDSFIASV